MISKQFLLSKHLPSHLNLLTSIPPYHCHLEIWSPQSKTIDKISNAFYLLPLKMTLNLRLKISTHLNAKCISYLPHNKLLQRVPTLRLSIISWGQFYVTERFWDFLKRNNLLIKIQPWLTFLWTTFCPCFILSLSHYVQNILFLIMCLFNIVIFNL